MKSRTNAAPGCICANRHAGGGALLQILVAFVMIFIGTGAFAASVKIGWTPANDSRVTGYEIGYGLASSQYSWKNTANAQGAATASQTVEGLEPGTKYYFAVRSVGSTSSEVSAYSTELSTTTAASADTAAPSVSITSPANGTSYVSAQTVTLRVSATDNVAVSKVELYDGGSLMATLTSTSTYSWAVTSGANGSHTWTAKAYDAAGNSSISAAVTLNVSIATADTTKPSVAITSPASGGTYTQAQTVTIQAQASDNVGVSKVELYDGSALKATLTAPYAYSWPFGSSDNGTHAWTAKAYDAAGNVSTSSAVSLTVAIQSAVVGCSGSGLWSASATPGTAVAADSGGVELGVSFTSDTSGSVCGVRFYKGGSGNSGTHIGRLWKSDGSLLAQATFTTESASGWQQVNFASPVAITTGTTYVASYYAPKGGYSFDVNYFTNAGVDAAPLHAAKSSGSAGNGLFLYGSGGFPTKTFKGSNYWVDVVFMKSGASDTTKPSVAISSPVNGANYTSAQTVTILAAASDNVGVSKVELYDGATLKATLSSSYSYSWSIGAADNGSHAWTAKAYDAAGNVATSNAVAVNVSIPATTVTCASGVSLWSASTMPATLTDADTDAVELGVKFKSNANGYICGVRFYKGGSANSGTHVGRLWTTAGAKLAEATFTGESASGWQQVNFASPVAVKAGTIYVASYHAPKGAYSANVGYFNAKGADNGPLHALQNGESGGNGVYLYGSGGFPNATWNGANYWVDVVFANATSATSSALTASASATALKTAAVAAASAAADAEDGTSLDLLSGGESEVGASWTRVDFPRRFTDPVLILKPADNGTLDPVDVLVDGLDGDGFWVRLASASDSSVDGVEPRVGYLVIERGRHQLPDGAWVEAGSLTASQVGRSQRVRFQSVFAKTPVVVTSSRTTSDEESPRLRLSAIDNRGFRVVVEAGGAKADAQTEQRIDYVAWQPSWGEVDGYDYEVGRTSAVVTDAPYTLVFPTPFAEVPLFIGDLQTANNGTGASLHWRDRTPDAMDLWVRQGEAEVDSVPKGDSVGFILMAPSN